MQSVAENASYLTHIYRLALLYVVIKICINLWSAIKNYLLPIFKKEKNFKEYGQWAVITGGTDGIGKGYATAFASKGVNVCIISRSEERLKNTTQDLESTYGVKTKYIIADFTNTNVYTNIRDNLSGLDIGILVNNVGTVSDCLEPLSDQSEQTIKDYININLMSISVMTSIVLPCMQNKKRGLIINMSSFGDRIPVPYLSVYCGCKAYISMFGTCVGYELKKHNIEMVTMAPGPIRTKLLDKYDNIMKRAEMVLPGIALTVPTYIEYALRSITSGSYITCVYYFHALIATIGSWLPLGLASEVLLFLSGAKKSK